MNSPTQSLASALPDAELGDLFLRALVEKDAAALKALVHPELYFHTPWFELTCAEDFLTATQRLWERCRNLAISDEEISRPETIIKYELFFEPPITRVRVVNVLSFGENQITEIEQYYESELAETLLASDGNTFKEIEFFYEARNSLRIG